MAIPKLCLTGLHNMYRCHNQKILYPLSAISSYIIPNQNFFLPKNKNFLYSFICFHFHKVPTGLDYADKEEKCPQSIADYLQCPYGCLRLHSRSLPLKVFGDHVFFIYLLSFKIGAAHFMQPP